MTRLLLWLLGGALLGGIVHLASVLVLPSLASQDAYTRLAALAPVNTVTPVPSPSPGANLMPFMDPAFVMAVCRYDLSKGPLGFSVPISPAYTAVSFYTRTNVAFYAINDRAAGRRGCPRGGCSFEGSVNRSIRITGRMTTLAGPSLRSIPLLLREHRPRPLNLMTDPISAPRPAPRRTSTD